jgi:hypothetical protein
LDLSSFIADVGKGVYDAREPVFANAATPFDFDQWLETYPVRTLKKKPDGTFVVVCPGSHGVYPKDDGHAFLKKMPGGGISMGCLHESCSLFHETGNHWREFRAVYEGQQVHRGQGQEPYRANGAYRVPSAVSSGQLHSPTKPSME